MARRVYELRWEPYLEFVVPGEPRPKQRAKVGKIRFGPKAGRAITRTPDDTIRYENLVKMCASIAKNEAGLEMLDCPVRVELDIYLPGKEKPGPKDLVPCTKPDGDNVEKAVLDACEKVLWRVDSRIVRCRWEKFFGDPRLVVRVEQGVYVDMTPVKL